MSETIWIDRIMDGSVDEDTQLALAARQNPAEYRHIYNKWLPRIYKYFYFRVGNEKDAEDLTSQVFLKAYETLPRYRDQGCFSAWLFAIAHARVVDHYRRQRSEVNLDEAVNLSTSQDLLARSARREEVDQVIRLLHTLTEDEQELIRLRFVAELSYVEIGAILNRREDAVRKATTRLLQRLQTQMEVENE